MDKRERIAIGVLKIRLWHEKRQAHMFASFANFANRQLNGLRKQHRQNEQERKRAVELAGVCQGALDNRMGMIARLGTRADASYSKRKDDYEALSRRHYAKVETLEESVAPLKKELKKADAIIARLTRQLEESNGT